MNGLIAELKRRNVLRVAGLYTVAAWLLVQIGDIVFPAFGLPQTALQGLIILLITGCPLVILFAWAFEITPVGLKRRHGVDIERSVTASTGRRLDFIIIAGLMVALAYFVWENRFADPSLDTAGDGGQVADTMAAARKSIAVLPFINMTGDPGQEFFSDGISEELLNVLANVKGLRVTSRTSAFSFKGRNIAIPEIAAQLGVAHVLEGSVRMAGNRVRITAQLIEVKTDSHLWSETYDRELDDIFAIQDEIAQKVSEAMKVALLDEQEAPVKTSRETSLEAYTTYLLALQKKSLGNFVASREAAKLLGKVIELDPGYAPAHEALAEVNFGMSIMGLISKQEAWERIRPLADAALRLDDRSAASWWFRGVLESFDGNPEAAAAAMKRASDLGARDPFLTTRKIYRLFRARQPDDLGALVEEGLRIDPLSPSVISFAATVYQRLGQFDKAADMVARIDAIDPGSALYHWQSAILALARGKVVEALNHMRKGDEADPGDPEYASFAGLLLLGLGDDGEAAAQVEAARGIDAGASMSMMAAALLHIFRGEDVEAVRISERALASGRDQRWGSRIAFLRILRNADLAAGRATDAIERYLEAYGGLDEGRIPNLFNQPAATTAEGLKAALDVAGLYLKTGEREKAAALLGAVAEEVAFWPRQNLESGFGIADAELHALRGDDGKAIAALRQAVDEGWRKNWWWELEHNPHFDAVRETSGYKAVVADIRARMAAELATLRPQTGRDGD